MKVDGIPFLVHDKWDAELAGYEYYEMRDKCLFAILWSERPEGGYNMSDFYPFVAMKKVINQGIEAYEGISLCDAMDVYKDPDGKESRVRKVGVHGRTYLPVICMDQTDRMTVVSNPDEILQPFLNRWNSLTT
jgi:hypothetical protein